MLKTWKEGAAIRGNAADDDESPSDSDNGTGATSPPLLEKQPTISDSFMKTVEDMDLTQIGTSKAPYLTDQELEDTMAAIAKDTAAAKAKADAEGKGEADVAKAPRGVSTADFTPCPKHPDCVDPSGAGHPFGCRRYCEDTKKMERILKTEIDAHAAAAAMDVDSVEPPSRSSRAKVTTKEAAKPAAKEAAKPPAKEAAKPAAKPPPPKPPAKSAGKRKMEPSTGAEFAAAMHGLDKASREEEEALHKLKRRKQEAEAAMKKAAKKERRRLKEREQALRQEAVLGVLVAEKARRDAQREADDKNMEADTLQVMHDQLLEQFPDSQQ